MKNNVNDQNGMIVVVITTFDQEEGQARVSSDVQICTHAHMRKQRKWRVCSIVAGARIKDGDMTWTERESSLKHHVRSNVKHQTKENAPGQSAAQVKSE